VKGVPVLITWREIGDAAVPAYAACSHARCLLAEQLASGEWRWSVRTDRGGVVASGVAGTASEAQEAAEHELYAIHLESDWIERQLA
jgi:hypothetical protein